MKCFWLIAALLLAALPARAQLMTTGMGSSGGPGLPSSGGLAPGFPGFTSGWSTIAAALTTGVSGDPKGGANAATITENSAAGTGHGIDTTATMTIVSGATYTVECFVKTGSGDRNSYPLLSDAAFTNYFGTLFNPVTGAVVSDLTMGTGSVTAHGSISYGNGWWKVWSTGTISGVTAALETLGLGSGSSTNYAGNGASNNNGYGCSVVAGSTPP
jgi:hypothetical protein